VSGTPVRFWVLLYSFLKIGQELSCSFEIDLFDKIVNRFSFTECSKALLVRRRVDCYVTQQPVESRTSVKMYGRFLQFPPLLKCKVGTAPKISLLSLLSIPIDDFHTSWDHCLRGPRRNAFCRNVVFLRCSYEEGRESGQKFEKKSDLDAKPYGGD
jgi:hypothetical protein